MKWTKIESSAVAYRRRPSCIGDACDAAQIADDVGWKANGRPSAADRSRPADSGLTSPTAIAADGRKDG